LTDSGWFRSGDAGFLDDDGFLYVKDRCMFIHSFVLARSLCDYKFLVKDIIIRGGESLHSTTVENALYEHPEIIDAAAVGLPDNRLGELVAAVVTVVQGSKLAEQEIIQFAKTKWVVAFFFVTLNGQLSTLSSRLPRFAVPVLVLVRNEPLGT
jgi:acyl-CoA synthetase (AMP-forming)/AMP-acid ligase II